MNFRGLLRLLCFLAVAPLANAAAVDSKTVQVTAEAMRIESDITEFQVGVPYHFLVTNKGVIDHEVMLIEPLAEGSVSMQKMDDLALGIAEAEALKPGATVVFDYTFKVGDLNTPLELACHVPGHYRAGMKLAIKVVR